MMKRSLTALALAAVIAIPAGIALSGSDSPTTSRRRPVSVQPAAPAATDYAVTRTEHYLDDDLVAFVRPGLKVKINSITNVAAGQKPVIDFNLMDDYDQPLDRLGIVTPGAVSTLGFILSRWDAADRNYYTYTTRTRSGVTNPSGDQGGKYTDLDIGHYRYEFGTVMPESLTASTTLTLGVYARRRLTEPIQKDYYADNVFVDFRPDGMMPAEGWGAMPDTDATCNRCHDVLAEHGGTRRTAQMCAMCHNNQVQPDPDTGESFNGKVLWHKIHMGANLPSVVAGGSYVAGADFSGVVFPQDIRNCETCHDQDAPEKDIWWEAPTRQACGSCHDTINWVTGENHGGGLQVDDVSCINCHYEDGDDFGPSVKGAHIVPTESRQLKGLKAEIVSVSNVAAGQAPTVVFKITESSGKAVDGTKLSASFHPILAGPTTSYTTYWREDARPTGVFDAAAGTTTYTFTNAIPEDAEGTWVISGDFRRAVSLKPGDGGANFNVNECAINPIKYIAVTDEAPVARRTSVTLAQCNSCHEALALHGGQRLVIEECVICHNPVTTDEEVRLEGEPESVSFQRMIHRIHTGEELINDYTVYGFRSSIHNYNHVKYPGDRLNCRACHTANGYQLPIVPGVDTVHTPSEFMTEQGPGTAACLGCHDSQDAMAHAYQQTAYFPGSDKPAESCGTCHGGNSDWSVDRVHAR